jgi:predicted TIM-barrel fold metal-dependent hydrolase
MSELLKQWQEGHGLPDTLVIDGHIHIGDWPHAETFQSVDEAVEQSLILMDVNGIDAACVLGGGYMWRGADYRLGNDYLLAVCGQATERMIPFMHVNPNDSRKNILAELDRMYSAGVRAIKLLSEYQDYPGDGPNLMAVYEYAREKRMLILNHSWTDAELINIAPKFPGVDFICGHTSSSVLLEQPNVYDNMWGYFNYGVLDHAVAKYGAGKFMLGSDGFLNSISVGIGPVMHLPISDDDKRLILGLNMAKLLDKVGILPKKIKQKSLPSKLAEG